MRLVVQRVSQASVSIENRVVGKIGRGLLVLVGIGQEDKKEEAKLLAEKLSKLRVMADGNDKMNLSVKDTRASILVVSQFTLYADTKKGNRPSFVKAADPKLAQKLYNYFMVKLKDLGISVETGQFGSYMDIKADLDGPVTIILESKQPDDF